MKIFDMPRCTGKTCQLAMLSEKTGYPVLVATEMERKDCERRFPKAKFISVSGWQWIKNKEERPKHIYVDEAFWVLRRLISYDVEIEGVSLRLIANIESGIEKKTNIIIYNFFKNLRLNA